MSRAATAALALLLAGCASDPGLGDAVRANVAAMTVPPPPRGDTLEGSNGQRGAAAVRRYLTDRVKQPVSISGATPFTGSGPVAASPAEGPR